MDIQKYNQSLKWLSIIALLPIISTVVIVGFALVRDADIGNSKLIIVLIQILNLIYLLLWCLWISCFFFSKRIAGKISHLASFKPFLVLVILTTIQIILALTVKSVQYGANREIAAWAFLVVYIILHMYFYFKAQESQKMHYIFGSALSAQIYIFVFIMIGFFSI